ncbi:t-SNARE family protein [Dictyostelium discoideum AX4]|uniref:t-SNARE family protein n=1 Tax=Dictyostelium discoideum TaxID=44689 RepID=Q869U2_DICDI|nr:t-SNARE family protein [Dictyostelium discoideum AX4]EAL69188.1 t-SNARE family protein [Dictyostelium discoideum AX4]|eukprot:XP_643157.1 t-SNARE family protein [Dictyostelium discoideum AX4]
MATRDRTPSYLLLKIEYNNRRPINHKKSTSNYETLDEENRNGMIPLVSLNNNNYKNGANIDTSPKLQQLNVIPAWMQRINDIDVNLSKIHSQIEKLKGYHDKNLLPDMSLEDQSDLERSIEITTSETTRLFHKTHDMIINLGGDKGTIFTSEDIKIKKNVQQSKSAKLQSLSVLFRRKQSNYLKALRKRSNSFTDLYNKSGLAKEEEEEEGEGEEENQLWQEIEFDFTNEQKQIVKLMEIEISSRDKEIRNLLESINDLTRLFQDISLLVAQQGTILDRIDYNLNETESMVTDATDVVIIINKKHKEYRSRLCILMVLVALVVSMIFIIILKMVF